VSPPSEAGARVRLLDDALVDQIAAGEVVERPASVVKELVENALDAGASRLRVEVRDGGAAFIAVTDDGSGMSPDDARLALRRHATSKIRAAADLTRIASFGFRGEALPAIASVSRLRLQTRLRGAAEGFEMRVEGGRITGERVAGGPEGTRIEVADLFAQVPARRKFLKKAATEWGHISDWLTRSALALPGVHFEVRRDDRPPVVWPETSEPLDRVAAVLGEREARGLVEVEREDAEGHVQAFVSSPEHTRPNAQGLYLFVNGRPVRDPLLRGAVLQAYRDWLPRGRFPTAVLFLSVAPERVDVNVHPAKWEVRFSDPSSVHALVRRALREAVAGRSWLGAGASEATGDARSGPSPASWSVAAPPTAPAFRPAAREGAAGTPERAPAAPAPGAPAPAEGAPRLRFGEHRLVGQLLASYLVVEGKDGLLLVDQHAAHERVLYERLRSEWLERGVERQGLLAPVTVELDPAAASALEQAAARVARLGFEVEPFGESAAVVRAVPALLGGRDPAALVRELAEELRETGTASASPEADDVRLLAAADRTLATLACHSARRFGDALPLAEQRAILDALDAIPWAPTCPHGRPVAVSLSRAEIERRFGRR